MKYGTNTVRIRTRKPDTVCSVFLNDFLSVAVDTRLVDVVIVLPVGSASSMSGLSGGREYADFRIELPSRVDGRDREPGSPSSRVVP